MLYDFVTIALAVLAVLSGVAALLADALTHIMMTPTRSRVAPTTEMRSRSHGDV